MSESFVNLDNARLKEQRDVMKEIAAEEVCPFCEDSLEKYHKQPILSEGAHWRLTTNQWPYEHTEVHLLAIARLHVEKLNDLQPGAGEELIEHFKWAEQEYAVAAGGLAMRFGDTSRNGATVRHLHAHLIVPKQDLKKDQRIRFKIS